MRNLILALVGLSLFACGTPEAAGDGTAGAMTRVASGPASAAAGDRKVHFGAAASQTGDAANAPVSVEVSRPVSNAQSGPVLQAFSFAAVADTKKACDEATKTDPVVQSLIAEMGAESRPAPERMDQLRAALAARMKAIQDSVTKSGGDLSNLHELNVTNILVGNHNGTDADKASAAEAAAVGQGISATVEAAKKKP